MVFDPSLLFRLNEGLNGGCFFHQLVVVKIDGTNEGWVPRSI